MTQKKTTHKDKHNQEGGAPVPKGRLLAIGGREDKGEKALTEEQSRNVNFESEEILKFLVKELRGSNPLLVLIPTASTIPDQMIKVYKSVFKDLGVKKLEVMDVRSREDAMKPEWCELIDKAAGVMFTGGDQLRLTSIFGGTDVLEHMKERFTNSDVLIAGTSAGAMALSTPMIYEGETKEGYIKGDVRITTGLEFLKNVAVDTHFIERGRIVRMAQCIATNPGCIGIGLEADTAIYVTNGKSLQVVGSGLVTVVDGMGITSTNIFKIETGEPITVRDLKVHLLAAGECYVLPTYDQLHI